MVLLKRKRLLASLRLCRVWDAFRGRSRRRTGLIEGESCDSDFVKNVKFREIAVARKYASKERFSNQDSSVVRFFLIDPLISGSNPPSARLSL